jgi:hypothetical protein
MAKYTGKTVKVASSAQEISEKFADLTVLSSVVDKLPESEREKIGKVTFETDAIIIANPQVGNLAFRVKERSANRVVMGASSPMAMELTVDLLPIDATSTNVATTVDIDIPMMLKPMIGPMLQKAADQFGDLMGKIAGGNGI